MAMITELFSGKLSRIVDKEGHESKQHRFWNKSRQTHSREENKK